MRIGIECGFLRFGSRIVRGIPRYAQRQAAEVARRAPSDEVVLLCDDGADRALIDLELLAAPNVRIAELGGGAAGDLAAAERRLAWMEGLELDVYHETVPFVGGRSVPLAAVGCPTVATFYDAIPGRYADHYLRSEEERDDYLEALHQLRSATRLLAISETARREACLYVGAPEGRVDVAYPVAADAFAPLPGHELDRRLLSLRHRLGIPPRFLLTVTGSHHSKNLEGLLRGYAGVAAETRELLPLLLVGLAEEDRPTVAGWARRHGVAADVLPLPRLGDAELAALYQGCELMLHWSFAEGFGLPVLEAMGCGAPVVASTAEAVREVAGEAARLVPADAPESLAAVIEELHRDGAARAELAARSLARAAWWRGEAGPRQLADATLRCYRAAVGDARRPHRSRPALRVAMWTPVPPVPSGVAGYAVDLVELLRPHADVELFVDDAVAPTAATRRLAAVHHTSAFPRRHARCPYDVTIYQLGGAAYHLYCERGLFAHRGIAVLHDLGRAPFLFHEHPQGRAAFERELAACEGEEVAAEYRLLLAGEPTPRGRSLDALLAEQAMLGPIVAASDAQIVHLEATRRELLRRHPDAQAHVVPLGVRDPAHGRLELSALTARARLGIAPSTFVVGAFGIAAHTKRVDAVLRGFAEVAGAHPDSLLLVVGRSWADYDAVMSGLARELGIGGHVRLTGAVDAPEFVAHLAASDVVVGLREPWRGEASATLAQAVAAGKPILTSAAAGWDYPLDFCWRVPEGDATAPELAAQLRTLRGSPALRRAMGEAARRFYSAGATRRHMADGYLAVIEAVLRKPAVAA